MRVITVLLALLVAVAGGAARAEADPAAGRTLYATCESCHGAAGEGNRALGAPRLSHLGPVYIEAQLLKFKSGSRGGTGSSSRAMQMAGMAAVLPDEQAVRDVAAYIATLDSPVSAVTVEGNGELGGDYFNQFCGACHGAAAEGNPALNSPRLAGSDDWYLLAQLNAFRTGQRGAHPEDRTGKQMRAMAGVLPDDQSVRNVVAFIRSRAQ
jgi:cytochrome c553